MSNEADTCRRYVLPKLYEAGWQDDQISEQKYFTDGRIVPVGRKHRRRPGKKTDYLLAYKPDFPINGRNILVDQPISKEAASSAGSSASSCGATNQTRF